MHDGVDIENYKKPRKLRKIKKAIYVGSFYEGRGVDIIINLAKKFPSIIFELYGANYTKRISKNLLIKKFVKYTKVPKILSSADLLLMPYKNKVFVNSNNLDTASYCSPLKMFDYLASGKIIMSTKLKGICEVLKDNYNCFLVNGDDNNKWISKFEKVIKIKNYHHISNKAFLTAKKYSWYNRAKSIVDIK